MNRDNKFTFTVFTPTYNRAKLLPRLFDSLTRQTFKDFEWVIVDDGSTDNTEEVVEEFKKTAFFPIIYIKKSNGGKHTAINVGVKAASGELLSIMDSDDWYTENALEKYMLYWQSIENKNRFLGVCGHFVYQDGEIVGDKFPSDVLDIDDFDLKLKYKVDGDKLSVIKTEIMREFPFPEDLGDFVTESLVWNRMAHKYLTRFVNDVFAVKEYQEGGLSDNGRLVQIKSPKSSQIVNYELITSGRKLPLKLAIKCYANYVRHSLHLNMGFIEQFKQLPSVSLFAISYPIGVILARRDNKLLKSYSDN